jgi:glycosyltransferase involved in cell wall biosynthesis
VIPVAVPVPGLLPVEDAREPLRVLIASLAPGGAERIVLEWLGAAAAQGRDCELAVLHARRHALAVPPGVRVHRRIGGGVAGFVRELAAAWRDASAPVSTHLIGDDLLAELWSAGLATVPVVHNMPAGWRNQPRDWPLAHVPLAVACSLAVGEAMRAAGCRVPIVVLRHRPAPGPAACDPAARARVRAAIGVDDDTLLVLAVGAFKPQKDHARAVRACAVLARRRPVVLAVVGGALDAAGLGELDLAVDAACAAGFENHLRLPGFVDPIDPWYAAADVFLSASRYEGLSMALREALAAGLPAVATDVGGQRETDAARLRLVPATAGDAALAAVLGGFAVRRNLVPAAGARAPRAWSLTLTHRARRAPAIGTLFVTANLNAGGAQRSLLNLATALAPRLPLAVAVCADSTQADFAAALRARGVPAFRPAATRDPLDLTEALLAWSSAHGVGTLVFWNADARVKLALARFAPATLRIIDVSPGGYAFAELAAAEPWARALDTGASDFGARLDALVLKYHRPAPAPWAQRVEVIPNGVAPRAPRADLPAAPRFLVSGRVAPSKRLGVILDAFRLCGHARAELHIVGSAEARDAAYAEALVRRAIGMRVVWRGALPALRHLAESWTAAIVLGTHQGSPNAVLEAQSAGIPVIANASGGTGETVIAGRTGWLLAEDCDARALRDALEDAIADPARNRSYGDAGRALVRAERSLGRMARDYLELFNAVAARPVAVGVPITPGPPAPATLRWAVPAPASASG